MATSRTRAHNVQRMTIHRLDDFDEAVPNVGVVVEVNEGPGEGNSAPTSITFRGFNTQTGTDQTVKIFGTWERHAAIKALRWIADRLDGQPDGMIQD